MSFTRSPTLAILLVETLGLLLTVSGLSLTAYLLWGSHIALSIIAGGLLFVGVRAFLRA